MYVAAVITNGVNGSADEIGRSRTFFDVTVLLLVACALATVVIDRAYEPADDPGTPRCSRWRPGCCSTGYINWDLFAVALHGGSVLAWARRRPVLAGVLLGLGDRGEVLPAVPARAAAAALPARPAGCARSAGCCSRPPSAWLVVNLPVDAALAGRLGHASTRCQRDARRRLRLALVRPGPAGLGHPDGTAQRRVGRLVRAAVPGDRGRWRCARRGGRGWRQLAFLVVAAFLITNKVYSPQYVLWLIALFPLARPRWRDFLIWQAARGRLLRRGLVAPAGADLPGPRPRARVDAQRRDLPADRGDAVGLRDDRARRAACRSTTRSGPTGSDDPGGGVLDGAPDAWSRAAGDPSRDMESADRSASSS